MSARILIAGGDLTAQQLGALLDGAPGAEAAVVPSLEAAAASVGPATTVVVASPSQTASDATELAASLREAGSDTAVLIVSDPADAELLRAALKAGVRDVLSSADGAEALGAAVLAADEAVRRRRPSAEAPGDGGTAKLGTTISVFSPKGGVGKSVLATNLGVALSALDRSTILVDLDLQFGDVAVMLQLPPERTIFDAAQAFDRLDEEMLSGFLVTHDSGLRALLAPVRPEDAESVTAGRIAQILSMLRMMADVVVIDTPASLSDVVLTALENSDVILAVATMDVPSVKNTKVALEKLEQLGFDKDAVRLVLNRSDSRVGLVPREIEKAVSGRIVAHIPSDRLVPRCVNLGVPVVTDSPRSAVARSIQTLARELGNS